MDNLKKYQPDKAPTISVVVPLFNEQESLVELYDKIHQVMEQNRFSYEIIFVDDGSTDGSDQTLEQLHQRDDQVHVFQFRKNYGKSAGLACGFEAARGQYVITMDADLQDDPEEIPHLIDKLNEGYDLVSGWKKKRYDPFIKRNTSKIFNKVTGWVSGLKIHDFNCGLKAYRSEVVKDIQVYGQLHRFIPVLAHWKGYRVGELVVRHHPRKYGKTKFGMFRFIAGLLDLFTVVFLNKFRKRPLHLFGSIGLITFLIGMIINLYLAIDKIVAKGILSNRPLLFLGILLVIVGIQFVSIGLLGEMITETQQKKADYSIKRILR
ncbi:MAG: glycosyltransferase family 2 protein [candidate division KSB1 bacterium]|nr:glycosyltransferase family 2 protein [candidate division KSB1 bacterium]